MWKATQNLQVLAGVVALAVVTVLVGVVALAVVTVLVGVVALAVVTVLVGVVALPVADDNDKVVDSKVDFCVLAAVK